MKKIYMTMVAMLCGVAAMAQTCNVTSEDVTLIPDGQTVSYLTFYLNEDPRGELIQSAAVVFTLPEGVSINKKYDEEEGEYVDDLESPISKKGHAPQIVKGASGYTFAANSASAFFRADKGNVLAKIGLIAAESAPQGEYDITLKPSFALNGESVYPQEPFQIKMTVKSGTGINSINADDVNAPVYNIAGQRVSKAQKGVYIQNGKKVAVK